MRKIIILENNPDDKRIGFQQLCNIARVYERRMNGVTSLDITDDEYNKMDKEYVVIPLMNGLSMKTIELNKNGLDIYIKRLEDIREELEA